MKKQNIILIVAFYLIFINLSLSFAQKVQVVSKIIERTVVYKPGDKIKVDSDKANVFITGWEKPEVYIKITLTSKHHRKKRAEDGLGNLNYNIDVHDQGVVISNNFRKRFPATRTGAKIEINAPIKAILDIQNKYGDIDIENIANSVWLDNNYGDIKLYGLRGVVRIKSNFGDIDIENVQGDFTINSNYSDVEILGAEGRFKVDINFGDILMENMSNIHGISVSSSKGDIVLLLQDIDKYNLEMETNFGDLKIPKEINMSTSASSGFRNKFRTRVSDEAPNIKLNTSFGDIKLKRFQRI